MRKRAITKAALSVPRVLRAIGFSVVFAGAISTSLGQSGPTTIADIKCEHDDRTSDRGASEAACLESTGSFARRSGDILELALKNGTVKTYTSNFQACDIGDVNGCLSYRLASYLPSRGYFLLDEGAWEGRRWLLVRDTDGSEIELAAPPRFSPSGKFFVAVAASEAGDPNRIDVWSATNPPRLEWRYDVPEGAYALYEFVRWERDERIKLNVTLWVGTTLKTLPAEASRTKGGTWILRGPTPTRSR